MPAWVTRVVVGLVEFSIAMSRETESYPAPEPGAGAGLSGAPPTETGPAGLGSGGRVGGRIGGSTFRDAWTTRARGFECGMLEVVSGGVTGFRREPTCAVSKES